MAAASQGSSFAALGQLPWAAHRSREHGVSLRILVKALGFGIPFELASQPDREVGQMADGGHPVADIDGKVRILAALHTFEEVIVFSLGIGV